MKWLVFLLLSSSLAIGQETAPEVTPVAPPNPIAEEVKEIKKEVKNSSLFREKSSGSLMVGYEFISTWLPSKFTGSYTYMFNKTWALEAEAARGRFGTGALGIDVASVSEYRYSLLARRFVGNSFHTIFGLYKDDFRAELGTDVVDDASLDDLRVEVIGVALGLGNRWQWESGFTFGIDWIRMNMPLLDREINDDVLDNISDEDDLDTIEDAIDKVSKVPTFVLLGIYLGYSF